MTSTDYLLIAAMLLLFAGEHFWMRRRVRRLGAQGDLLGIRRLRRNGFLTVCLLAGALTLWCAFSEPFFWSPTVFGALVSFSAGVAAWRPELLGSTRRFAESLGAELPDDAPDPGASESAGANWLVALCIIFTV
jgi:hypothetical protein